MFGDIALNQSGGRTASIICKSPCYLFELTEDDYNESIKVIMQKEKSEKLVSIVQALPNMQECLETVSFEKIVYSIKEVTYNLGTTILREGCQADRIYVLKEGEVLISRKLCPDLFKDFAYLDYETCPEFFSDPQYFQDKVLRNNSINKDYQFARAMCGEVIGADSSLDLTLTSKFTFTANSQPTVLYYIKTEDLHRYFTSVIGPLQQNSLQLHSFRMKALLKKLANLLHHRTFQLTLDQTRDPDYRPSHSVSNWRSATEGVAGMLALHQPFKILDKRLAVSSRQNLADIRNVGALLKPKIRTVLENGALIDVAEQDRAISQETKAARELKWMEFYKSSTEGPTSKLTA